ncbi:MAG: flavodoxin family protein [Firmicutes bacterium]|nr:flavodoxin family protein [Bacillota bacterium]MDH7494688.1 flavodoxin family protein [Bacillota bacterium]
MTAARTLIVFDSVFGNTEQVARAMGKAIGSPADTETLRASEVRPEHLNGLRLLIVGSPTRAFRPTKPVTDFLDSIPPGGLKGVKVAAFDTRISAADVRSRFLNVMVRLFGYAAKPIADRLEKKGGALAAPPEGFFVKDSEGPLKDGELERAAAWAKSLVRTW